MALHELTSDQILTQLWERQEAYLKKKDLADRCANAVKAQFALSYKAVRDAEKVSVKDAEQRVLSNVDYIQSWEAAHEAGIEMERAKMALERARTATELWRSDQASKRLV